MQRFQHRKLPFILDACKISYNHFILVKYSSIVLHKCIVQLPFIGTLKLQQINMQNAGENFREHWPKRTNDRTTAWNHTIWIKHLLQLKLSLTFIFMLNLWPRKPVKWKKANEKTCDLYSSLLYLASKLELIKLFVCMLSDNWVIRSAHGQHDCGMIWFSRRLKRVSANENVLTRENKNHRRTIRIYAKYECRKLL